MFRPVTTPDNVPLIVATSKLVFAKLELKEFTSAALVATLVLKLPISFIAPVNEALIEFTMPLVVATLLLKLATSVNTPDTDPLNVLTVLFVFAKLLLIFATSKFVLDILPAKIPKPGTVGAVAVPDKSPAS